MTTPRYPLTPLAAALNARHGRHLGRDALADILDVSDTTIDTWRIAGVPAARIYACEQLVDRHPAQLWDTWDRGCNGAHPLDECTCTEFDDDTPADDPPLEQCTPVDPDDLRRRRGWQVPPTMDGSWRADESPTKSATRSSRRSARPRTSARQPAAMDVDVARSAA